MTLKERLNRFPFDPQKIPFFYGWIILIATVFGVLASAPGQTMGVSTFTDYLIKSVSISRNQISLAYMSGTIASSLILTWAGKQYDRYGARWTAMTASIILGLVLVLLSRSDKIILLLNKNIGSLAYSVTAFVVFSILFFILRFSGQGVLTMVSRNMLMKWFIARRGFANGIASVFITLAFSIAPLSFDKLIQSIGWRGAWIAMAIGIGVVFMIFVFLFFRDNPEDLGMIPDGEKHDYRKKNVTIRPIKQYTLKEARKTMLFWLYAIPLSLYTLYVTGFTFHLVSIFQNAGLERSQALSIFVPISFLAVTISFTGGWISDRIKLKYLLYIFLTGEFIALFSLANLNDGLFYYGFILGHGMANGLYNVLMTVSWPRFFGRQNLGKISGFVMSLIVFTSALGPILFSISFTGFGGYGAISALLALSVLIISFFSRKAENPQDKFEIDQIES